MYYEFSQMAWAYFVCNKLLINVVKKVKLVVKNITKYDWSHTLNT